MVVKDLGGDGLRPDCPYHAVVSQFAILRERFGEDKLQSLPLFPDRHGKVADKATVVLALEATVKGYGEPTVGANGSRLLGGHSFRVTGAQRLAAAGVEIIKIMSWPGGPARSFFDTSRTLLSSACPSRSKLWRTRKT